MPTLTIDGKEITVDAGKTVIQAAEQAGIELPRYCYHPGLSIVGQCRICLVEVEKMPKLQVACYTPVMDGMVVHTDNERVRRGRKNVLEFLLVNHPIDCPVCDQAGECFLQDYYMKYGLYDSKMLEDKNKKHKALDIGRHIVLDSERCILCTRCVRFCDEISKTNELGIFNRGDHAELLPYPGVRLDNPYSVNVVDICPVGALTEKDFRFRNRVWYLEETDSICAGCSTGCNISVHANTHRTYKNDSRRIARLKPRFNPDVNDYWICDEGRYSFRFADAENRLTAPHYRLDDALREGSWEEAIGMVAGKIRTARETGKRVAVIGSPQMTNEDLFALQKLAGRLLGEAKIPTAVAPKEKPSSDDFLIREDKHPNTKGAALLGFSVEPAATKKVLEACAKGEVAVLLLFHHDLSSGFNADFVNEALEKAGTVVFIGTNENETSRQATFVLPACTYFEKDGTFTNYSGRVQRINRAIAPLGMSRPEWMILRMLAKQLGSTFAYFEAEDLFNELVKTVPAFDGMTYAAVGASGLAVSENGKTHAKKLTEPETASS